MSSIGQGTHKKAAASLKWRLREKTRLRRWRLGAKTVPTLSGNSQRRPAAQKRLKAQTGAVTRTLRLRLKVKTGTDTSARNLRRRLTSKTVPIVLSLPSSWQRQLVVEADQVARIFRKHLMAKTRANSRSMRLRLRVKTGTGTGARNWRRKLKTKTVQSIPSSLQRLFVAEAAPAILRSSTSRRRLLAKTIPSLVSNISNKMRRRLRVKTVMGPRGSVRPRRLRMKTIISGIAAKEEARRRRLPAKTRIVAPLRKRRSYDNLLPRLVLKVKLSRAPDTRMPFDS